MHQRPSPSRRKRPARRRRLLLAIGALITVLVASVAVTLSVYGDRNTDAAPTPASSIPGPPVPAPEKLTLISALDGPARTNQVAARIAAMRLMNYYPAANGWTMMWTDWNSAVLRADFARIRGLGANTVRIIVFPHTFGWPTITSTMATRFADTLQIAASEHLGVQLTLFNWWNSFSEVSQSQAWLRQLLDPYASDPEIQLVELANEVNPSDAAAVAWVRALLPTLRSVMPHTPSTVSVSGTEGPAGFAELRAELAGSPLDVADIHFYDDAAEAYAWMLAAKRAAGPLPLLIGEAGYPVIVSGYDGLEGGELRQAQWYSVVFAAARAAGIPPPAPWILYDFESGAIPPPEAPAPAITYHFGLYSASGQWRPSVWVVKEAFAGQNVDFTNSTSGLSGMHSMLVWTPDLPQQGELAYDPEVGYLQPGSVRLSSTHTSQAGSPAFSLVPTQPAIPGQQWTVSVWAKGTNINGTAQLSLSWFNSSGVYLGESSSKPLPQGNPSWTQLVVRTQVPPDATSVQLSLKSSDVAGTVWFDDVQITVSS